MPAEDLILVFNSGSSSLKVAAYLPGAGDERLLLLGSVEGIGQGEGHAQLKDAAGKVLFDDVHQMESQEEALRETAKMLEGHLPQEPSAVGHRVVHGGPKILDHTIVTSEVLLELEAAVHFAPLHLPSALRILKQARGLYPRAAQVACFDTVFHKTMPEVARRLTVPNRFYEAGVRRYGFHGLSCESVMSRLERPVAKKIVIAHLGGGSSVTAIAEGRSIDTSMGMSPTGGVPMSLRSGDLDPAVLLYLMRTESMNANGLEHMLNHESGLMAISNGESDMQALLARTDEAARLAVEVFCVSVRKAIGSYGALMGGIDLLVFTGGIGQHSAAVREKILSGLEVFDLRKDSERVRAMPAEEEIVIARHSRELTVTMGEVKPHRSSQV